MRGRVFHFRISLAAAFLLILGLVVIGLISRHTDHEPSAPSEEATVIPERPIAQVVRDAGPPIGTEIVPEATPSAVEGRAGCTVVAIVTTESDDSSAELGITLDSPYLRVSPVRREQLRGNRATLRDVASGQYVISVLRGADILASQLVIIRPVDTDVEVRFTIGKDVCVVSGSVKYSDGRGVEGCTILAALAAPNGSFTSDRSQLVVTASDGAFRLKGLCEGAYLVTLLSRTRLKLETRRVIVSPANLVCEFVIRPVGCVRGQVRGGRGGSAAVVLMMHNDEPRAPVVDTNADDSGQFQFDAVPEGKITVIAQADGFSRAVRSGVVVADAITTINVDLQPGGTIRGVVRGPARDLSGTVLLEPNDRTVQLDDSPVAVEPDGTFVCNYVPYGEYTVTCAITSIAWAFVDGVTVSSAAPSPSVDIDVAYGAMLKGHCEFPAGPRPTFDGRITVRFKGEQGHWVVRNARLVGEDDFVVEHVCPGPQQVLVRWGEEFEGAATLQLMDRQELEWTFTCARK